jgi:hypothetical protein
MTPRGPRVRDHIDTGTKVTIEQPRLICGACGAINSLQGSWLFLRDEHDPRSPVIGMAWRGGRDCMDGSGPTLDRCKTCDVRFEDITIEQKRRSTV